MQEHSIAEEEALILSKLDKKPFYLGEVVTKIPGGGGLPYETDGDARRLA